jgi:GNAT superfamily N-acetyltransferase
MPEQEFIIRPAIMSDAEAMARINIDSWRETYSGLIDQETLDAMTDEEYIAKWQRILRPENELNGFRFVAEIGSTMVGYVGAGLSRAKALGYDGELYALYLLKKYHGKGIGKALFLQAVREFKAWNMKSFHLYVLKANKVGRSFYDKFAPDEVSGAEIKIKENMYCDMCYGWRAVDKILT